jgi:hypothetical protein
MQQASDETTPFLFGMEKEKGEAKMRTASWLEKYVAK